MDEPIHSREHRFWDQVATWWLEGPVSTVGPLTEDQIELFLPSEESDTDWRD
jgi:hypothetical protein